jgi:hypothetical protein
MRICRASLGVVAVVRSDIGDIDDLAGDRIAWLRPPRSNRMRAASGTTALSLGDVLIGRRPAAVLLGIYLIIPQFP